GRECRIFSYQKSTKEWLQHASAEIRADGAVDIPAGESLAEIQMRFKKTVPVEEHYQRLAERGLTYGPTFRGVRSLSPGKGEALARIELPEALASDAAVYNLHPAVLDAALQAVGVL